MKLICEQSVAALDRFYTLTDYPPLPNNIPETFMASYVFDHLGNNPLSLMPEVPFSRLWEFNEFAHERERPDHHTIPDECDMKTRKVDLVMFTQEPVKQEQGPLGLIELKKSWRIYEDVEKVCSMLSWLDQYQFGAACGIVELGRYNSPDGSLEWLDWETKRVQDEGDQLIKSKPITISSMPKWPIVAFSYIVLRENAIRRRPHAAGLI
jgi:hypothetical protein